VSSSDCASSSDLANTEVAIERPWVVYLLRCAGGRLYAGITNDLASRYEAHASGRGARFTRAFPPEGIVLARELGSRSDALKAEFALKKRARSSKVAYLRGLGRAVAPDPGLA
jgi:putative endonuclease